MSSLAKFKMHAQFHLVKILNTGDLLVMGYNIIIG